MSLTSILGGPVASLVPALPQSAQNGNTQLGTLNMQPLPDFITAGAPSTGFPWGSDTALNTDPYKNPPITGVTRVYNFDITHGYLAPDGVNRSMLLVNGQFPAPMIEANWGDEIQVTVNNKLLNDTGALEEGTALHWHGLLQKGTQYFDGVPAVSQCPIAPGKSLQYKFKADLFGTSWYHSHYSAQYAGGLVGPMIIYGPKTQPYDIDLGPVMLSDWYHKDYYALVQQTMSAGQGPVFSDNNLINGKMDVSCNNKPGCTPNAGLSKFKFQTGKTHRLRLINSGAEAVQTFSIDNHTMTVIANDFVPIKPYKTNNVTLGIGQRTDVLVTATGKNGDAYWMRSNISTACSLNSGNPNALAAIYYPNANTNKVPTSPPTQYIKQCQNDNLAQTTPLFPFGAQPNPATTKEIDITFAVNASGVGLFQMNGESFRGDYNAPILELANAGNTSYPQDPEWNVYNFGSNSSIRLVVYNKFPALHPMHLHGHNFFVLATGNGKWNGQITNQQNPQRRDVQILPAQDKTLGDGFIVIQINADNPGAWPFHCHIAWHVSAGLYITVLERPADIAKQTFPKSIAQSCQDWWTYTGHDVVPQIDSGL